MDPNDNRIIVQLVNTCFMYVTSRDLNRHLHEDHDLPVVRYNRPEPAHIEMIPTDQFAYLNMLAPNFVDVPQDAVFVSIRHACSLCHFHYPTLERLLRHMEAHFRTEIQQDNIDEIDRLNESFDFFDSHHMHYTPDAAALHQQGGTPDAIGNDNRILQANDGMINGDGVHAADEDAGPVEEGQPNDQQNGEHATPGVYGQTDVDDDHSEKTAVNNQQDLDPQDMNGEAENGLTNNLIFNNNERDITLGPFVDHDNVNLNDQPIFGDIAPQERVAANIEDDNNTVFEFVYFENH
ncbi:hypothetical protein MBANPS3_004879 [Mucor bainieri]